MSIQANEMICRQFIDELVNRQKMDSIDHWLARGFVEHEALPPGTPVGREGVRHFFAMLREAFPDLQVTVDDTVAASEKVVLRMTWRGTQQGAFLGVAPTGRAVAFGVIDIFRVANGQIAEHWGQTDGLGLMQQLGAIPGPGQPSEAPAG